MTFIMDLLETAGSIDVVETPSPIRVGVAETSEPVSINKYLINNQNATGDSE